MKKLLRKTRRPLYYYYILAMVVLMALNTWVFPAMFKTKVSDLSYDAFIQMVDEGKFGKVEISDKRIAATAKDPEDKKIYVTGRVDDNQLVEKLMKSKVTFSQVIPKESGPLESIFYNWILPILFFFIIGQLIMRYMGGKGFGGMGNFGKSNAKVYMQAQTGVTSGRSQGSAGGTGGLPAQSRQVFLHRRYHAEGRVAGWPSRHR